MSNSAVSGQRADAVAGTAGVLYPAGADHYFRQQLRLALHLLECDEITSPFRQCAEYVRLLLVVTGGEPPEWLIREFAGTHKLPLRFFLEAGVF